MKVYSTLMVLMTIGVKVMWSNHGFVYDASAHLSATYFNEDRKGVEDSSGYLKGPYRKVIE